MKFIYAHMHFLITVMAKSNVFLNTRYIDCFSSCLHEREKALLHHSILLTSALNSVIEVVFSECEMRLDIFVQIDDLL